MVVPPPGSCSSVAGGGTWTADVDRGWGTTGNAGVTLSDDGGGDEEASAECDVRESITTAPEPPDVDWHAASSSAATAAAASAARRRPRFT